MGCFLDDLRAFGINPDQWTTAAHDEGGWRRTAEQGAEHCMAKWIATKKARAGLRHAVVCPKVTGITKQRITQSKALVLVRSPLLTSHKWRELVSPGRLVCRYHDVFIWCYLCLVLLLFRLYAFVEAAALRSIVLRYAGASIATRVPFFFFLLLIFICRFCRMFLYHCRFLFVWKVHRTRFPSGWYFLKGDGQERELPVVSGQKRMYPENNSGTECCWPYLIGQHPLSPVFGKKRPGTPGNKLLCSASTRFWPFYVSFRWAILECSNRSTWATRTINSKISPR